MLSLHTDRPSSRSWHRSIRSGCLLIAPLIMSSACVASPIFTGLGDLPGGGFRSEATRISPNGEWVVGQSETQNADGGIVGEAFIWSLGGGLEPLGIVPGMTESLGSAISNDGSVVVGLIRRPQGTDFRWERGVGYRHMGSLLPGGVGFSNVRDMTPDGKMMIGVSQSFSGFSSTMWRPHGGATSFGGFSGIAVSTDGSVVATSLDLDGLRAGRWTRETGHVALPLLSGGTASLAFDISSDGSTNVGRSESLPSFAGPYRGDALPIEATVWTGEEYFGLGYLPGGGTMSFAQAVSADGSVVVGRSDTGLFTSEAFIWTRETGMLRLGDWLTNEHGLKLEGWKLLSVTGISDDGQTFVGAGMNPSGSIEGFFARVPTPGSAATLGVLACWSGIRRRR